MSPPATDRQTTSLQYPLTPTAVPPLPKIRRDVLIHRRVEGNARYFDLRLPGSKSVCSLYDFEFELTKKMNGARDLDGLVHEAARMGMAIDRTMMEKFIRGLVCYQLIENAVPVAAEELDEVEQVELERTVQLEREGLNEVRATMMAPAIPPPPADADFEGMPTSVDPSGAVSFGEPAPAAPRRFVPRGVIAAAVVAVMLGGVLWSRRPVTPPPTGGEVVSVTAQTSGVVSQVLAPNGKHVAEGELLAVVSADSARSHPRLAPLVQNLSNARTAVERMKAEQHTARHDLEIALSGKKQALALAEQAWQKARRVRSKRAAADRRVKQAREGVRTTTAELAGLDEKQIRDLARIERNVAGLEQQLAGAHARVGSVEIRAPRAGVVITDVPAIGQQLEQGQPFLAIRAD